MCVLARVFQKCQCGHLPEEIAESHVPNKDPSVTILPFPTKCSAGGNKNTAKNDEDMKCVCVCVCIICVPSSCVPTLLKASYTSSLRPHALVA